jgi:hypothetical protein
MFTRVSTVLTARSEAFTWGTTVSGVGEEASAA